MSSPNPGGPASEVKQMLSSLNPKVRPLARNLHKIFIEAGCDAYAKTIYIGYDLSGEMVAAVYGHADRLEVALAVDENRRHPLLVDASHLTWRTLPMAANLRSPDELEQMRELVAESAARISEGTHNVNRDNEFFRESKRARRSSAPERKRRSSD